MRFRRHVRHVRLQLRFADPATATAAIAGTLRATHPTRFSVRVHDDGSIRARVPAGPRSIPTPILRGRIVAAGSGTCLEGTIRETWSAVCVPWLFVFVAVFMAAVLVGLLVNQADSSAGVIICGAAAVAFALIAGLLYAVRPMAFDTDSNELLDRLTHDVLAPLQEPGSVIG